MQGVHCIPRVRQVFRRIHGLKDVSLEQQVGIQAGTLQPVHGGHELPPAVGCQTVAGHLSQGPLALNQASSLVALKQVVPSLEGGLLDLEAVRA